MLAEYRLWSDRCPQTFRAAAWSYAEDRRSISTSEAQPKPSATLVIGAAELPARQVAQAYLEADSPGGELKAARQTERVCPKDAHGCNGAEEVLVTIELVQHLTADLCVRRDVRRDREAGGSGKPGGGLRRYRSAGTHPGKPSRALGDGQQHSGLRRELGPHGPGLRDLRNGQLVGRGVLRRDPLTHRHD